VEEEEALKVTVEDWVSVPLLETPFFVPVKLPESEEEPEAWDEVEVPWVLVEVVDPTSDLNRLEELEWESDW
jgi:hypothetical protein